MEGKEYAIFDDAGKWYVEMQENRESYWIIAAGPFGDEAQAQDALAKMRDDDAASAP